MPRPISFARCFLVLSKAFLLAIPVILLAGTGSAPLKPPVYFELKTLPFRLENDEGPSRNAPETMPGGVAAFDYNGDGRPDIFFTNGASMPSLEKTSAAYANRLYRNDGGMRFTD